MNMDKLNILVVDDEPGIRMGVKRVLQQFEVDYPFMDEPIGFNVVDVETGEEAIELLNSNNYDVVFLDNKLPGIQGIEVLEYINKNMPETRVIMITSYASLELAVKATKIGAYDFVPKPFTPAELRACTENVAKQVFLKKMTKKLHKEGRHIRFQFLSLLSHELKNPIGAVEGYLKMIKERKAGNNIDSYDEMIMRSLERLNNMRDLIMDLLDLSKISGGEKNRELKDIDISQIAKEAINAMQPMAIQKDIQMYLNCKENIFLYGDTSEIEMIFNNLISNAIKYNEKNGRVDVFIEETPKTVKVVVADTGIGISKDDQQKLFNEFVRIKNTKTKNISGSGLGLSIVSQILENYHAEITVNSKPNEGSEFIIVFNK